jgi:hypothetical protein
MLERLISSWILGWRALALGLEAVGWRDEVCSSSLEVM